MREKISNETPETGGMIEKGMMIGVWKDGEILGDCMIQEVKSDGGAELLYVPPHDPSHAVIMERISLPSEALRLMMDPEFAARFPYGKSLKVLRNPKNKGDEPTIEDGWKISGLVHSPAGKRIRVTNADGTLQKEVAPEALESWQER